MLAKTYARLRRSLLLLPLAGAPAALAAPAQPAPAAPKPAPGVEVEAWVRAPGKAADQENPAHARPKIDLRALSPAQVTRLDLQYNKKLDFWGVPLASVIAKAAPPAAIDLALLHFANGMVVPLPFRDAAVMNRLQPFVALKVRATPGAELTTEFPPLTRKIREYVDIPDVRFVGNKLVVAELWHPALTGTKDYGTFSPWSHVDALVGVEFVQSAPYYKQFDVDAAPGPTAGLALFRASCQFCHGARQVGARFGWDFVEPMPLYTYRGEKRLYYHVHYRRLDAPERGQNMPALKFMTEADAGQVWQWLKAVGTKPMPPYTPTAP